MEQVEMDFQPRCDDGTLPLHADMHNWYRCVDDATWRHDRPLKYNPNTRDALQRAGFVNIHEVVIRVPLNTWEKDPHRKHIGRWYSLALTQALNGLTLKPLCLKSNWSPESVATLVNGMKKEIVSKELHVYNEM